MEFPNMPRQSGSHRLLGGIHARNTFLNYIINNIEATARQRLLEIEIQQFMSYPASHKEHTEFQQYVEYECEQIADARAEMEDCMEDIFDLQDDYFEDLPGPHSIPPRSSVQASRHVPVLSMDTQRRIWDLALSSAGPSPMVSPPALAAPFSHQLAAPQFRDLLDGQTSGKPAACGYEWSPVLVRVPAWVPCPIHEDHPKPASEHRHKERADKNDIADNNEHGLSEQPSKVTPVTTYGYAPVHLPGFYPTPSSRSKLATTHEQKERRDGERGKVKNEAVPLRNVRAPAESEAGPSTGPGTTANLEKDSRGSLSPRQAHVDDEDEGSSDPAMVPLPESDSGYKSASTSL